jgi:uncharacterized integral membrane protein
MPFFLFPKNRGQTTFSLKPGTDHGFSVVFGAIRARTSEKRGNRGLSPVFGEPAPSLKYRAGYATLRLCSLNRQDLLMKFVNTIVGFFLFVLFFGFALKNTQEVDLHFFLNYELRGPLVLMLLAFFVAGAALGILAVTPTVFRHRRETSQHKNTIQALQSAAGTGNAQPQPDSVDLAH